MEAGWGDSLVASGQFDAAISHYIEAGQTLRALEAAIQARQWGKAGHIVQVGLWNDQFIVTFIYYEFI